MLLIRRVQVAAAAAVPVQPLKPPEPGHRTPPGGLPPHTLKSIPDLIDVSSTSSVPPAPYLAPTNGWLIASNAFRGKSTVPHRGERTFMCSRYARSVTARRAYHTPWCSKIS